MSARDPIDALTEALRLWGAGKVRPTPWDNLTESDREWWRKHARLVNSELEQRGFELVPTPAASGGTKA